MSRRAAEVDSLPRSMARCLGLLWQAAPRQVALSVGLMVISGIGTGLKVVLTAWILDYATRTQPSFWSVLPLLIGIGVVVASIDLCIAVRPHVITLIEARCRRRTGLALGEATSRVPYGSFDDPEFHGLLERARHGTQTKLREMIEGVEGLIDGVVTAVALTIALLVINPMLTLAAAIACAPSLITSLRGAQQFYEFKTQQGADDLTRDYLSGLLADPAAAKEIRTNRSQTYLSSLLTRLWGLRINQLQGVLKRRAAAGAGSALLSGIVTTAVAGMIVAGVMSSALSVPAALAAVLGLWELTSSMQMFSWSVGELREDGQYIRDYEWVLERATTEPQPDHDIVPLRRSVVVRDVYFHYPGRTEPVLRGVDLELSVGRITALVGVSGAGKSTLVKLLAGIYPLERGSIRWDGVDSPRHPYVAVQFQDFERYQLPLTTNVEIGDPDHPLLPADLDELATQTGLGEVVAQLPAGTDTWLTRRHPNGVDLSGGQWQRVAVARALRHPSRLLILDEPTSALDALTETRLMDTLDRRHRDRAVLVITHRLSTARRCDDIYVMDQGRIVERGSHDRLLGTERLYSRLWAVRDES